MAKQTRLEKEAIELRNGAPYIQKDYSKENEYNSEHPDARATGDIQGKGTGIPMGVALRPGETTDRSISRKNLDTTSEAGGLYDIEGRNGIGGRKRAVLMNLYGPENEYGDIDTSANVLEGQYVFK